MLTVDGADGGGQVLRTALTLAVLTDTAFRIESIRGSRPEPGLGPQHLAAVELAASFCDATVEGAALGAEALVFEPGGERRTSLAVEVDTAGALTLLFDTLLPVAPTLEEPLVVTATGGTDVKWAPTAAYLRHVKLPLLARFGLEAACDVERTGFYPAGSGEATLRVRQSALSPLDLERRGPLDGVDVHSTAAETLAGASVADRQADAAAEALGEAGLPVGESTAVHVPTASPGSSLLVRGRYGHTLVGADALGERGVPAEEVATDAVARFLSLHADGAIVDPHMADQLLVFLAVVGGRVAIPEVTPHVESGLAVAGAFDCPVHLVGREGGRPTLSADGLPGD